jgi:hypothetical protein
MQRGDNGKLAKRVETVAPPSRSRPVTNSAERSHSVKSNFSKLIIIAAFAALTCNKAAADLMPGAVPAGGMKLPKPVSITEGTAEDASEARLEVPLAGLVVPGDLVLCETGPQNPCVAGHPENWSDLLRFGDPNNTGKSSAVMYSVPAPEEIAGRVASFFNFYLISNPKVDPFSGPLSANVQFRDEPGATDDSSGGILLWTPGGGNQYAIVSDPTPSPEPSALLLFGTVVTVLAIATNRKKRTSARKVMLSS